VAWFVLEMRYVDADARQRARARHLEYIRGLAADGRLVAAGPWMADGGSLTVYEVAGLEEAQALMAADPYVTDGVTEVVSLREWKVVVQREP
jgi:uncharacterized protein YciI